MEQIKDKLNQFGVTEELVQIKRLSGGHINTTYLIATQTGQETNKYVLQKINQYVFKNPEEVMQNIMSITTFIRNKLIGQGKSDKRRVLKFLKSKQGKPFIIDDNGDYWRMYEFVDNSTCYDSSTDLEIIEQTGRAFGEFQHYLDDYKIENLNLTIPNFHNLPMRYEYFKDLISQPIYRKQYALSEIERFFALEKLVSKLNLMQMQGKLPLRVTHNDTKCNNVLFDKQTKNYLCVIDLDTVMPGLVAFDYGDAIRCIANTTNEDEKDLSKVKLDLNKFKAFTKGFLNEVGDKLTDEEKQTLVLGPISIATELALRFLTDYLEGDKYFKIDHENHNLDRARCQLALAENMISQFDSMKSIIKQYLCENKIETENDKT